MRSHNPFRQRRLGALAGVVALAAAGLAVSAPAAHAATGCEVDYQANVWTDGPNQGGFVATITITNTGDPISGWLLEFTLPPGQEFTFGWSALWPPPGTVGLITAENESWNGNLGPGNATQIGFTGRWIDAYSDPESFRLNGVLCNGEEPVDPIVNPYLDAQVYVDPEWSGQALAQAAETKGELGEQMAQVATYPTAVWLDRIGALTAGQGLVDHLDAALIQQQVGGGGPMVVQLVLFNLPGRDCAGLAAPGELSLAPADRQRYRTDFIDPIVDILSSPNYADLRIVTIVEPVALPSALLFGAQTGHLACQEARASNAYVEDVRYALSALASVPNVYNYLDASYSGFFGYHEHFGASAEFYHQVVAGGPGGLDSVTGIVTNVAQYAPIHEPFLPDPDLIVGGVPIWHSKFFDFNRRYHELFFAQELREEFIAAGFPADLGLLLDTSRNGWGGPDRPVQVSTSNNVDIYVNESRVDRRPDRFTWCNQVGSGIGERPEANPAGHVHAYVWVKPPGISDGVADPAAAPDPERPYLTHRTDCDPDWFVSQASFVFTNAMPGAPHAGHWFPELFAQLVANAYPPVG